MVDQLTLQTIGILLTGLTVSVAAIYYTLTLRYTRRNQELTLKAQEQALETRQAQLFMQLYDKTMSKEFADAQNEFHGLKFNDYREYKDWMMNLRENTKKLDAWLFLVSFYEGLGLLVMEELVSTRMVTVFMGSTIMAFYNKFGQYVHQFRDDTGSQGTLSETEYLYNRVKKYIEENPDYRDYQLP